MPKKRADATPTSPDLFFANELAGEEPPSFAAMKGFTSRPAISSVFAPGRDSAKAS